MEIKKNTLTITHFNDLYGAVIIVRKIRRMFSTNLCENFSFTHIVHFNI